MYNKKFEQLQQRNSGALSVEGANMGKLHRYTRTFLGSENGTSAVETAFILAVIALCIIFAGCSRPTFETTSSSVGFVSEPRTERDEANGRVDIGPNPGGQPNAPQKTDAKKVERKIVYRSDIEVYVNDFDSTVKKMDAIIEKINADQEIQAIVSQAEVISNPRASRTGNWTIRVSVDKFDDLRRELLDLGEPTRNRLSSDEVTEEYYDLDARMRNAKKEEESLLRLMDTDGKSVEDILKIRGQLSQVRGDIERWQGRLRVLDSLTSLATINFTITERGTYVPEKAQTFTEVTSQTFFASVTTLIQFGKFIVLAVVALVPWLPIVLVIGLLFWFIRTKESTNKKMADSKTVETATSE